MKTSTHFLQWLTVVLLLAVNVMETMAADPSDPTSPHSVCLNYFEPYGVNLTTLSTYAWTISDPSAGTIIPGATPNLITVNWKKTGNYTLQVIETNVHGCVGLPVTIDVVVNPLPMITNKTATICSGDTFTESPVNVTDIVPTGTTYTWSEPVAAGITGLASGTGAQKISGTLINTTNAPIVVVYNVTPKSGNCPGATFTVTVTVNPKPTVTNKPITTICSTETFTISPVNNATDIVPAVTTYTWNEPVAVGITGLASGSGALNISGTLTNTTNAAITVVYTVTPTSGTCVGASFTVTVRVNPKATIADKTPAAICSGGGFTVSPNGTDIVPAFTSYTWSEPVAVGITGLASGSGAATISGTLINTNNAPVDVIYTVTPTSGTCSGANFTVTVRVYPRVNTSQIYHN